MERFKKRDHKTSSFTWSKTSPKKRCSKTLSRPYNFSYKKGQVKFGRCWIKVDGPRRLRWPSYFCPYYIGQMIYWSQYFIPNYSNWITPTIRYLVRVLRVPYGTFVDKLSTRFGGSYLLSNCLATLLWLLLFRFYLGFRTVDHRWKSR